MMQRAVIERAKGVPLFHSRPLGTLLVLLGLMLVGCSSAGTNSESLFERKAGVEVGEKLEIPDEADLPVLREFVASASPSVICFLSTECDATNRIIGRLKSVEKKRGKVANFLGFVTSEASRFEGFVKFHALEFKLVGDFELTAADLLGANRTPAFFVFDADRKLVYKGPLDDSTLVASDAKSAWLVSAIDAASSGKAAPESRPFVGKPILGEH